MIKHWLTWFFKSTGLFLIDIPITLFGLIAVAIGYPFRREFPDTKKEFTQFPGEWVMVRMPKWLSPWDNEYDGMRGDRRGWWDNYCREKYGVGSDSFKAMYLWTAVRNPANYWSRRLSGVDLANCKIMRLAGNVDVVTEEPGCKEWHFLMCEKPNGSRYYRFFMSWAYDRFPDHGIMIDIGWKFKMEHNNLSADTDDKNRIKGSVYTLSPWKKLT